MGAPKESSGPFGSRALKLSWVAASRDDRDPSRQRFPQGRWKPDAVAEHRGAAHPVYDAGKGMGHGMGHGGKSHGG